MSKANFLATDEFAAVVGGLVEAQVSVHSYSIGPEQNIPLLATLANHTGGMVYVELDRGQRRAAGGRRASSVFPQPGVLAERRSVSGCVQRNVPPAGAAVANGPRFHRNWNLRRRRTAARRGRGDGEPRRRRISMDRDAGKLGGRSLVSAEVDGFGS